MLDNYYADSYGVIHQIEVKEFNKDYASQYNSYGELSNYISYLRYGWIVGAINKQPSSILDIGYGNGAFLKVCKQAGVEECYGEDVSNYPVPDGCYSIKYDNIFNRSFDIITMFDSFEHFKDLSFIENLKCTYLVISVPNCCFGDNDEWFKNWKHRREDEHLHHFNTYSLRVYCETLGYQAITVSAIEDVIRKDSNYNPNIITMCFKKKS